MTILKSPQEIISHEQLENELKNVENEKLIQFVSNYLTDDAKFLKKFFDEFSTKKDEFPTNECATIVEKIRKEIKFEELKGFEHSYHFDMMIKQKLEGLYPLLLNFEQTFIGYCNENKYQEAFNQIKEVTTCIKEDIFENG